MVRSHYEAYNRCDFDAVMARAHPDMVLVRAGGQGEIRGPERIRAWMEPDAFASQVLEPFEFDVAADRVLVHVRGTLRGAGSGIQMKIGSWTLWTFDEDGRISRIEVFLDHEEAEARRSLRAS